MSRRYTWRSALKLVLLLLWVASIIAAYLFLHTHHVHWRDLPHFLRWEVHHAGSFGPFVIIGLYVASTIFLVSKGAIDIVAGAVYGPVWGSLIVLVGLNVAGVISFWFGRYFGRHFVETHERGWIKKYDEILQEEGFMTVLIMRLLFFPFDIVSIGCGMSQMSFRQYFFGTLIGSVPSTVTLVMLGGAFGDPDAWAIFIVLFVISLGLAFWLRRLPWVRRKLYKERA